MSHASSANQLILPSSPIVWNFTSVNRITECVSYPLSQTQDLYALICTNTFIFSMPRSKKEFLIFKGHLTFNSVLKEYSSQKWMHSYCVRYIHSAPDLSVFTFVYFLHMLNSYLWYRYYFDAHL